MSSHSTTAESTTAESRVDAFSELFFRSISLKVAASGVVMFVLAVLIELFLAMPLSVEAQVSQFDLWGLWAAIIGIWGGTLFLLGTTTFALVWWKRQ